MADWVLGLDGGGTKTLLALADRTGRTLGPFVGAGINPFDQPLWQTELENLLRQCPVSIGDIAHATFGLPGYGESPTVSSAQLEAVRGWAGTPFTVRNDVGVAFTGALAGQPGVLVLAGTGSMAWAGDGGQLELRVGGWGDAFGDEGSAYWIGQQALQRLSWALDGRLSDATYRDGLLAAIGIGGDDLIAWYYRLPHPRSAVAGLAKRVDRLAEAGNPTALDLLNDAARHLVGLARAATNRLSLEKPQFTYAGGLFQSRLVCEAVRHGCEQLGSWLEPCGSPLFGALLDAAARAGWAVNQGWMARVNLNLQRQSQLEPGDFKPGDLKPADLNLADLNPGGKRL